MEQKTVRYMRSDLFPISMFKIDCSEEFTLEDQNQMIKDIDHLIDVGMYEKTGEHPLYQTKIILFNEDRPEVWKRLKQSFYNACFFYMNQLGEGFCKTNPINLNPVDSNAWAFKSWKSLNEKQNNNPIHSHYPAFLSGIFYLKVPTGTTQGTEFFDPRDWSQSTPVSYIMEPDLFSWIIFPGWLPHKSCLVDSEDPRYVIAANLFVAPCTHIRLIDGKN